MNNIMRYVIYILAVVIPFTLIMTLKSERPVTKKVNETYTDSTIVMVDSALVKVNALKMNHEIDSKRISSLNKSVVKKDRKIDETIKKLEKLLIESDSLKQVAIEQKKIADTERMNAVVAKLEAIEAENQAQKKLSEKQVENAWLKTKIKKLEIENEMIKRENQEIIDKLDDVNSNKRIQRILK